MSRKLIGIPGWASGDNLIVSVPYLNYLSKFGEVIILTPSEDIVSNLDLVILPGGPDISSFIYGQKPDYSNSNADKFREYFFMNNLPKYIAANIPVFGICLGMQQINVHFGGTLIQNHAFAYSSKSRDERVEILTIDEKELNRRFCGNQLVNMNIIKGIKVNSLHHQGVTPTKLGEGLKTLAVSKECGNVEVLYHETLPVAGVQYHPEELMDDYIANNIIKTFLNIKKD